MSSGFLPPRVLISWSATALGTSFGGYNVWRRPSRSAVKAWEKIGAITVPSGYTAATVEAQHTSFVDYEAGWSFAGAQWADGWDYAVSVYNAVTGIESQIATVISRVQVTPETSTMWVVSNAAPYLNFPVTLADKLNSKDRSVINEYEAAGRDLAIVRTPIELPPRYFTLGANYKDGVGQDPLRTWRAAAASGRAMALLLARGDRVIGVLDAPSAVDYGDVGLMEVEGRLVETSRSSAAADYNRPAGIVLNGTSQFLSVADNTLLNPTTNPFSIVVAGVFANAGASRYALSKGNIAGAANGYAIRTTGAANWLEFFLRGASGNGSIGATSATWFDGNLHVATATHSGTAQNLYQDDTLTPIATGAVNAGSITNAVALAVGADNAGAANFMALNPVVAFAYFPRVLSAAEAQAAARYLLGYPGYRVPAGASLFIDLRDRRTWPGYGTALTDLAALPSTLVASVSGTPATRGIPMNLVDLEDF